MNRVTVIKENYKMQVPNQSYSTIVNPSQKSTNAVYLETDRFILLFFSIQYLVFFQQVLKPVIFLKNDKEFKVKDKQVNIIQDFEIIENDKDIELIFPNKYDIKKIIIPSVKRDL